ncbi:hypothetical protein U27_04136 [Candidatus Vecturithrix granuli]|uniref:Uncharacterized protein n=1 Tax=Vecturithrix granuli TaxID=1499967 RepID=A0A081BXW6_VECG1|nr:hypothetical protein U27_04136 [Candidatus Vecturithrix granuli]
MIGWISLTREPSLIIKHGGDYCTYYYYPRFETYKSITSNYATWLIKHSKMTGYVVYEEQQVIAWCNVGNKEHFPRLQTSKENILIIEAYPNIRDRSEYSNYHGIFSL